MAGSTSRHTMSSSPCGGNPRKTNPSAFKWFHRGPPRRNAKLVAVIRALTRTAR